MVRGLAADVVRLPFSMRRVLAVANVLILFVADVVTQNAFEAAPLFVPGQRLPLVCRA